jgi:hypothetical protein
MPSSFRREWALCWGWSMSARNVSPSAFGVPAGGAVRWHLLRCRGRRHLFLSWHRCRSEASRLTLGRGRLRFRRRCRAPSAHRRRHPAASHATRPGEGKTSPPRVKPVASLSTGRRPRRSAVHPDPARGARPGSWRVSFQLRPTALDLHPSRRRVRVTRPSSEPPLSADRRHQAAAARPLFRVGRRP